MSIKENLQKFYDKEAKKYASTRKKHRSDAEIILNEIKKSEKKNISILEFGCGSGRLLEYLKTLKGIKITYIGVDLSEKLLSIAKDEWAKKTTKNISCTFVHADITEYIKLPKQESCDYVIGIASFQHIPTYKERLFLMKNFYRILKYDGKIIMTNRALSVRFLEKYKKQIVKAFVEYLLSLGKRSMRDIMIPRTSGQKKQETQERFYHIFSLQELKKLVNTSGFSSQELIYLDQEGSITHNWKEANNSFLVAKKDVFIIA